MVASSCNAAVRWHHDGVDVLLADESDPNLGRPMGLLEALGMEDLADKLPRTTLAMGDVVGGLTREAAEDLGLEEGVPVVQGGPDGEIYIYGKKNDRFPARKLLTKELHRTDLSFALLFIEQKPIQHSSA